MANYRLGGGGNGHYEMAAAAAAAWREPESPQLSLMSGCSSLFSISGLRDDDTDLHLLAGARSLPSTPVSFGGFPGGYEVDMELRQGGGSSGEDPRTIRMMRNRESALRSRARKRVRTRIPTFLRIYLWNCIRNSILSSKFDLFWFQNSDSYLQVQCLDLLC
uniref:BZIP domain-containing protein n=1 Tax=Aegilops tauschii subsp. strangulata TaxID=200361 RepID=A0A453TA50_AEGTS